MGHYLIGRKGILDPPTPTIRKGAVKGLIFHEGLNRLRQRIGIALRHEHSRAFPKQFGNSSGECRDDGHAPGHGLHQRNRDSLFIGPIRNAGKYDRAPFASFQAAQEIRMAHRPEKSDLLTELLGLDPAADLVSQRSVTGKVYSDFPSPRAENGERLKQITVPLLCSEEGGEQKTESFSRVAVKRIKPRKLHSYVHDYDLPSVNARNGEEFISPAFVNNPGKDCRGNLVLEEVVLG